MLDKPKYKLVATADGYDYKAGQVLTQSDEQQSYGGPWGWMMQEGKAEWQENVATLAEVQDAKWSEIKSARELAINAPIEYLGVLFDFDAAGQKNLSDAVIAAQSASALGVPFPDVAWTLYDNTTKTLTRTDLLAFPLQAGIVRKGEVHAKARLLREEIYKPDATIESVNLVKWEA